MEYNGIQLNSCIPHNTVFATLQRAKAALSSILLIAAPMPLRLYDMPDELIVLMIDNSMRIAQQLACTNIILRMRLRDQCFHHGFALLLHQLE